MLKKLVQSNRGQAMVEMAIVLPILLLLMMGIVDLGRVFSSYLVITNASREGAREAALGYSDDIIRERVAETTSQLDSSTVETTVTPDQSKRDSGQMVTVQVNYQVNLIAPLLNNVLPNPVRLQAATTMRVE